MSGSVTDGVGQTVRVQDLWRDLSRVVVADRSLDDGLGEVTDSAARGIPGAESTSITRVRGDRAFTAEEAMTLGHLGGWNVRKTPLHATVTTSVGGRPARSRCIGS